MFPLRQLRMRSRRLISQGMEATPPRETFRTLSPMLLMRQIQESEPSNTGAEQTLNIGTDDICNLFGNFTTKAFAGILRLLDLNTV